jgi:SAM-dependent methyltransferase
MGCFASKDDFTGDSSFLKIFNIPTNNMPNRAKFVGKLRAFLQTKKEFENNFIFNTGREFFEFSNYGYERFLGNIQLKKLSPLLRGKNVLDIGCGCLATMGLFAKLLDSTSYYGVDIDKNGVLSARYFLRKIMRLIEGTIPFDVLHCTTDSWDLRTEAGANMLQQLVRLNIDVVVVRNVFHHCTPEEMENVFSFIIALKKITGKQITIFVENDSIVQIPNVLQQALSQRKFAKDLNIGHFYATHVFREHTRDGHFFIAPADRVHIQQMLNIIQLIFNLIGGDPMMENCIRKYTKVLSMPEILTSRTNMANYHPEDIESFKRGEAINPAIVKYDVLFLPDKDDMLYLASKFPDIKIKEIFHFDPDNDTLLTDTEYQNVVERSLREIQSESVQVCKSKIRIGLIITI